MRVRFDQKLSPSELRDELGALCDDLTSLGVEAIAWANLYFTPMIGDQAVDIRTSEGTSLVFLSVDG